MKYKKGLMSHNGYPKPHQQLPLLVHLAYLLHLLLLSF